MDLLQLLAAAKAMGASDIHLVAGLPPYARVRTLVTPMDGVPLRAEDVGRALESMATPEAMARFESHKDADFSFDAGETGRYRVNAHLQNATVALALRAAPARPPALTDLELPPAVERMTRFSRGLVLVTGHTGSGKSTTLAAMINEINARDAKHIITLEDPIEFAFRSDKCLIEQRELGRDLPTFASGLRHALRQDPDVILVGEMRDLETASLAISAAETGHLVIATLHTINASRTVERIVDMFPAQQQQQVRAMLADTLQGVVSQTLFRRQTPRPALAAAKPDAPAATHGMVAAVEILLCTPAVRNVIREARTFEIPNVIETSRALGMQSLDSAIADLCRKGQISREDALARAVWPDRLERQLAA